MKKAPLKENTTIRITSLDINGLKQVSNGHLPCPGCSKPWFFGENMGDHIDFECRNCKFDFFLDTDFIKFEPILPKEQLECPKCKNKTFAIQIAKPHLCIGCRKCDHQWLSNLSQTEGGIHLLQ